MLSSIISSGTCSSFLNLNLNESSFLNETISNFHSNQFLLNKEEYDLVVIGGGSGGMAAAFNASEFCKKRNKECNIALVDNKIGLGGTCLNVGEVPKKLMHFSSLIGSNLNDCSSYGWQNDLTTEKQESIKINWKQLVRGVKAHIKYEQLTKKNQFENEDIDYIQGFAKFIDPNTIETTKRDGTTTTIRGKRFVIAVGGSPRFPPIPGAREYGISSDNIFELPQEPGRTLIVGAGYIALETAGLLKGMGYDVSVLVRTDILGGMDLDCANRVIRFMEEKKDIRFLRNTTLHTIEKHLETDRLSVVLKNTYDRYDTGPRQQELFDTVFFGIGRNSSAKGKMGLEDIGVEISKSGKIVVNEWQQSSVPHIYSVGDCMEGTIALTPVAIKTGELLAQRLFDHDKSIEDAEFFLKDENLKMKMDQIPTTVFTPVEYAYVGLSEEEAAEKYKNIEVYYSNFNPLKWSIPSLNNVTNFEEFVNRQKSTEISCLFKLIVDKDEDEKVLGLHYVGPDAGEIVQGVAIALKTNNLKKCHFDNTIGIHPTIAENMVYLTKKKSDPGFLSI